MKGNFRQVNPVEARLGHYMETFPWTAEGVQAANNFMIEAEKARKRNRIDGEIVYTKMSRWGKGRNNDTLQVFILRK